MLTSSCWVTSPDTPDSFSHCAPHPEDVELPWSSRGDVERDGGKRRLQWIATQGPIQRAALVARTRYTHRHAITPRMQQKQLTSEEPVLLAIEHHVQAAVGLTFGQPNTR